MQSELAGRHIVLGNGFVEQSLEKAGIFGICDPPSDNAATKYVDDDVTIELVPRVIHITG
jgi:hypothetical protein